jgi:phage replication O-like protein O
MASPQAENGYTKIANEILEKLYEFPIDREPMRILLFILRKTYGYHKKRDKISLSQFVKALKKDRSNICQDINKLISMKIIIKIQNDDGSEYEFNKDYEGWVVSSSTRVPHDHKVVSSTTIDPVSSTTHTKETITKEKKESVSDAFTTLKNNKPTTEKGWRDLRRAELGKPPTRTPRSEKQVQTFDALKWKTYFRDQGYEQHGMQFFRVTSKSREAAVTKLMLTAKKDVPDLDFKSLIDWWFANGWGGYEPELCFMPKTIDQFLNSNNIPKKGIREVYKL